MRASSRAKYLDAGNGGSSVFDAAIRERLLETGMERYEDTVDLIGEVRAAELKAREGGSFVLQLEDGNSVPGVFTDEQETKITEALHAHRQLRLAIVGQGQFEASGQLRRILRVDRIEERPAGEAPFDPEAPPIWETVMDIGKSIPEKEWDQVPADLAENLDHYLYGRPKDSTR